MRITVFALAGALAMAACSPASETKTETPAAAPASVFAVQLRSADQFLLPTGSPISVTPVEGAVRLAGHVPNAFSYGATQGAAVTLGSEYERAISNHRIRVTIRARSTDGATGFTAAYSTADVGNSEWRPLPLTPNMTDVSFLYQVQTLDKGENDFIGIMPPPTGSVEVESVRVDFLAAEELRQ